ncbi:hypothetical protein [Pseudolactococcus laudensis]|uniref:hypothetical protein n=1 Tax=Pseudolactococcus laudensis TaxID=1494461 RepID=UPI0002774BFB|nr:hypothetical protein BN193_05940 [Lactococcus raffinolactis 4877]
MKKGLKLLLISVTLSLLVPVVVLASNYYAVSLSVDLMQIKLQPSGSEQGRLSKKQAEQVDQAKQADAELADQVDDVATTPETPQKIMGQDSIDPSVDMKTGSESSESEDLE